MDDDAPHLVGGIYHVRRHARGTAGTEAQVFQVVRRRPRILGVSASSGSRVRPRGRAVGRGPPLVCSSWQRQHTISDQRVWCLV